MRGIIYCIKCLDSNKIYIGSTIQPLAVRKSKHIYDSKKPLRAKPIHRFINKNGDWSNFEFEKLEEKEYDNIKQSSENQCITMRYFILYNTLQYCSILYSIVLIVYNKIFC